MKLRKKEADYFESMVYFNEAKTLEEKRIYFERMMSLRKLDASSSNPANSNSIPMVLQRHTELIGIIRFKGDFSALARLLNPSIRPDQAEKAIRVLEDLKFIAKDGAGIYRLMQISSPPGPKCILTWRITKSPAWIWRRKPSTGTNRKSEIFPP